VLYLRMGETSLFVSNDSLSNYHYITNNYKRFALFYE